MRVKFWVQSNNIDRIESISIYSNDFTLNDKNNNKLWMREAKITAMEQLGIMFQLAQNDNLEYGYEFIEEL